MKWGETEPSESRGAVTYENVSLAGRVGKASEGASEEVKASCVLRNTSTISSTSIDSRLLINRLSY